MKEKNYFTLLLKCLGRGGRNKSRENPGLAKKGGGGSDPCQDLFGGFDIVN